MKYETFNLLVDSSQCSVVGPDLHRAMFIYKLNQSELPVLLTCPHCCRSQLLLACRSLVTGRQWWWVRRKTVLYRHPFRICARHSHFTLIHSRHAHVCIPTLFFDYFHFWRL